MMARLILWRESCRRWKNKVAAVVGWKSLIFPALGRVLRGSLTGTANCLAKGHFNVVRSLCEDHFTSSEVCRCPMHAFYSQEGICCDGGVSICLKGNP